MSKIETNTIAPSTGTTLTIGESGDTVQLGTGATQSGFGGVNTPSFSAKMSSGQDIGYTGVWTKLNFTNEQFDIGSYYDATNSRFTPPSGKYFVYYSIFYYGSIGNTLSYLYSQIYKNGSGVSTSRGRYNSTSTNFSAMTLTNGQIFELNGTDYLEAYALSDNVSVGSTIVDNVSSIFGAYKIIE